MPPGAGEMSRTPPINAAKGPRKPPSTGATGSSAQSTGLDRSSFRIAAWAVAAVIAAAATLLAVRGSWVEAGATAALAALALFFLSARRRLPAVFSFLFVLAGAVNAAGYVAELWKTPSWFDEAVHAGTSFTVMAAIGWLMLARSHLWSSGSTLKFALAIGGIGLGLGLLWEVFEWVIGIIGSHWDTFMDLIMDTIGAVTAALFCAWAYRDVQHRAASTR